MLVVRKLPERYIIFEVRQLEILKQELLRKLTKTLLGVLHYKTADAVIS